MPRCPNCGKDDCKKMNRPPYEVTVRDGDGIILDKDDRDTILRASRYLHRRCPRCDSEMSIEFHYGLERCGKCGGPWPKEDNDYEAVN